MLDITNPATGALVERVETDSLVAIGEKAKRARAAQPGWAALPLDERTAMVRRFRDALVKRREELSRTLTTEVGKPIKQSRSELTAVVGRIDYFLAEVPQALREEEVSSEAGLREAITREPLGVIANISAWNYPYFVGSNVFVPALLTGNAVLYKPSEFSTLTGLAIADALHDAGVPQDVFAPIIGAGDVGASLLQQPIDGVFFTGSYATGKLVAAASGAAMVRVQLELGGKDPVYVTDDVDVPKAAASLADGAFYNTGQSCCSVERIYLHEDIHEHFADEFLKNVRSFVMGDPADERTYIGPVTRRAQLGVLDRQVADARTKGAHVRLGGARRAGPGNWFEPTVLTDVTHAMEVMREESFGPIIGLQAVGNDEEALRLMQDTPYGLTAGVYSRSEARARSLLSHLSVGSAYWNACDRVSPRLPWSGRGHSGVGVTLGREGILAMTQPKAWHLRSA
ncbi:MAG: aldehyde dehydrogenase family protein [Candidatus Thermoplasmatota archaeon]